jgi:hypothetical protein
VCVCVQVFVDGFPVQLSTAAPLISRRLISGR